MLAKLLSQMLAGVALSGPKHVQALRRARRQHAGVSRLGHLLGQETIYGYTGAVMVPPCPA